MVEFKYNGDIVRDDTIRRLNEARKLVKECEYGIHDRKGLEEWIAKTETQLILYDKEMGYSK